MGANLLNCFINTVERLVVRNNMMCIRLLQGAAGYIIPLLSFIQYCVTYAFILVRIMHFGHIY